MDKILEVKNLKKYYKTKNGIIKSVNDVSFDLYKGETLGIVGESGSGKSTIARTISRLVDATDGKIIFNGENVLKYGKKQLREYRKNLQMIFQDPYSSLNPRMTCYEIIAEPLVNLTKLNKKQVDEKVKKVAELSGLSLHHLKRYPHEFSGGQRQRIMIARSLIIDPKIIIADEPTSALDVSIQAQIINLLEDLKKELGLTTIFISHDLAVVEHISDRVAVMYLGEIVEIGDADKIFYNPQHSYTKRLIASIPAKDPFDKEDRRILKKDFSKKEEDDNICIIAGKCENATEICRSEKPELVEIEENHSVKCHKKTPFK